ncbi:TRAP transporter substrate-binding protein [Desulforamulus aquiferis]|uniref:TRAP transporter substrate-binding protein n=1 Tax=Desulforamulus aquiferis TaxID=1397668 RepID=A0AAW7ZF59_9FIRM|nr:TRAP transporter substrate-binding protein [Desulforamulus aquiferis]MDO7787410.1 TRAP transporter substrate-binding protein [Desulforamulus aquiferis]RYD02421.1 C4-dicarboxylate ABC transporter [Desulforamulus aquiferis]
MRKFKTIISVLVAAVLALSLVGCGGGSSNDGEKKAEKVVIKFSHVVAETTPKGQAALKFKELVEQKSGGQMEVQVFPSSQLVGDKEELEALLANNIQIIAPSVTKLVGFEPSFQLVDMPFLFASDEAAMNFYNGPMGQKLMHSLEPKGMLGIAWWPNGAKHFTNNKRPLKTPEDFKGLKFRTQSGGLLDAQFKALGAGSQTLAFAEVYQALQNGTVDGQENTFNNTDTQKYQEVQKYLTVSGHGRLDYVVLTNTKFWNSLTPEQQNIFNESMQEATEFATKLANELNDKSRENIEASGKVEFYELTEADREKFIKVLEPLYAEYEGKIGKEYIDAAKASK